MADMKGSVNRWALGSLALSMLLASLGTSIANIALPTLTHAFGVSFQEVQWVVLAYLLTITIMSVSVGRLGDLVGRRRVLLTGIALFTIASILCGIAPTLWTLVAARAVQGLAAAILMALTIAQVGETVPKSRTGTVMGLLGTMSAIGTALGPSLGGLLIAGPGWRSIFLVMVPLGLINLLLAQRHVRQDDPTFGSARGGFDSLGALLLGLTLAAYTLSMTLGHGRFGVNNVALLVAAGIGLALFAFVETKVSTPLVRLATLRKSGLRPRLVMTAIVATVMMATLLIGPFYLSIGLRLDAVLVGLVMAIGPAISTLSGVPAGHIVDRFGAPLMVVVGLVVMAVGAICLAVLPEAFGVIGYVGAIFMLTPGYQLFQAANNTAVMQDVDTGHKGAISGVLNLSRNLGLITGASAMGAVFASASGASNVAEAAHDAVASGMQTTFGVAAILLTIAAGLAVSVCVSSDRASMLEDDS
ncbi:MFS transporter [Acidihalobacter prosperus]|uniref:MFS transporter n=1 Tax=Acidihalobacter prosperus TaxID=160660 RepID=A0A1A6C4J2_9GAMM|nr:MFS transporter [Acidihalobacter prosperus]OBS09469.1 MFS transporter [Acidihalobacter prosperus]